MNYEKKKVLVVGMARSGVAAAQLLAPLEHRAIVKASQKMIEKED